MPRDGTILTAKGISMVPATIKRTFLSTILLLGSGLVFGAL
ncbi:hypothetical protein [Mesorhizobium sp.]|nr:hypothetical protein [Mesorhizobium sp.]